MKSKHVFCVLSVLTLALVTLVSCTKDNDNNTRVRDRYGYDQFICQLPSADDANTVLCDILRLDNCYYAVTYDFSESENDEDQIVVYRINEQGNHENEVVIDATDYPYAKIAPSLIKGNLALVSIHNSIDLFDLNNGLLTEQFEIPSGITVSCVEETEDGFVIMSPGSVTKIYDNGETSTTVVDPILSVAGAKHPLFESDGNTYMLCYTDNGFSYCAIDFKKGTVKKIIDPFTVADDVDYLDRDYILNSKGIRRINIEDNNCDIIAYWSEIDIRPETKTLYGFDYYIFDDDHFVKSYIYPDGTIELLLFEYNSNIDNSGRQFLTIGGYGVSEDLAMKWAIYRFNTSQEEYRIQIDDYNERFSWTTASEAAVVSADLIRYFEDGNAPDMFYGNSFDFGYLGRHEMLYDMSSYLPESCINNCNIADYQEGEPLYSVYAGYTSVGFWGCSNKIGHDAELSYAELKELSELNSIPPFFPLKTADIVDMIIRYDLDEYAALGSDECDLSISEIEPVIDFAVEYGVPYDSIISYGSAYDLADDSVLLVMNSISDIYTFESFYKAVNRELTYVGYPARSGSVHICYPIGAVGISSSGEHIDACIYFMECLLDQETQKVLAVNGYIPVNNDVLHEVVSAAVDPENVSPDDSVLQNYVYGHDSVDQGIADLYYLALDNIDKVSSYDWGVYNIIVDEINSYDTQGRDLRDIAESLSSRLKLYIEENYS